MSGQQQGPAGSWSDAQAAWRQVRDAQRAEREAIATQAHPSTLHARRRATDRAMDHLAFVITPPAEERP